MRKKTRFHYFFLLSAIFVLHACRYSDISELLSPMNDTTKLWPAYDTENHLFGYIDANGEMKIEGQFLSASTFSCGTARVQLPDQSYGYIDKQGLLLTSGLLTAEQHYENLAAATTATQVGYINQQGRWCIVLANNTTTFSPSNFSPDKTALLTPISKGDFLFIDKTGKTILALSKEKADFADNFKESLARFRKNSLYGYINVSGEVAIPAKYQFADDFHHGFAMVKTDDYATFINKRGELIGATFDNAKAFSNEMLAPVCKNQKWGYADTLGNVRINFSYDYAYPFYEHLAVVSQNKKFGAIDKNGTIIIPIAYDGIQGCFHNGLILTYTVSSDSAIFSYLNTDNTIVYQWKQKRNSVSSAIAPSSHFILSLDE